MDPKPRESTYRGQRDGPSCPGCGLANYQGMCPHCRGDQDAYERELVPPFESSLPDPDPSGQKRLPESDDDRQLDKGT